MKQHFLFQWSVHETSSTNHHAEISPLVYGELNKNIKHVDNIGLGGKYFNKSRSNVRMQLSCSWELIDVMFQYRRMGL